MALQLSYIDINTQVPGNYFKIFDINNDPINNVTSWSIGFYISNNAQAVGASALSSWDFNNIPNILTESQCEDYLIANYPMFTDAIKI